MDRATRVMSAEYDLIYVQEATELTEDDWEALLTRLRNGVVSFQQLLADCNPSTPTHWLKARADRGKVVMLNSAHRENPRLFNDSGELTEQGTAYMANLDALTGVRRQRLKDGLWSAAEGVIYDGWRPEDHLIDRFEIPQDWARYWVIDWGFTNPFVLQCWAETPDGALIMYREIYHTQRTVDVHADQIMRIVAPDGVWIEPRPSAILADHDAGDRAMFTKRTHLSTTPANKAVDLGIQAVQRRLAGVDRIMLMRDSLVEKDSALVDAKKPFCTADEVPGYVWDRGVGQVVKETPLKKDDHGCDCVRYLVAHKDLGGTYRVRFLG
jgi:phage terminase large subunit